MFFLPYALFDCFRTTAFQDMNFATLRAEPKENAPRACVFQNADPGEPMNPFEILMAYEEFGRVMPVVSGKFIAWPRYGSARFPSHSQHCTGFQTLTAFLLAQETLPSHRL